MKIVTKSNDISLKSLYDNLVTPVLEAVAWKDSRRSNARAQFIPVPPKSVQFALLHEDLG